MGRRNDLSKVRDDGDDDADNLLEETKCNCDAETDDVMAEDGVRVA